MGRKSKKVAKKEVEPSRVSSSPPAKSGADASGGKQSSKKKPKQGNAPANTAVKGKTQSSQKKADPLASVRAFHSPSTIATNPTMAALAASGGISATKELRYDFTDYFDTSGDAAAGYFQWVWDPAQSIFTPGTATSSDAFPAYVRGAELYALPKFALDSKDSSILFITTCPATVSDSTTGVATSVQSTLILPTSVQKWVRVGRWSAKQIFGTSNYLPSVSSSGGYQAIFSGVCLNPDSLAVVAATLQCKIVLHISQSIPPIVKLGFGITNSDNPDILHSVVGGISIGVKDCMVQVTGVSDSL